MMFCPKCGSLLKTKQEGKKTVQFCSCGYSSKLKEETSFKEKVAKKEDIQVVEEKDDIHPLVDADCEKCGHDKAYFWLRQTRAGDEPETKFYKCEKCKHTWRDYS
jgi:DNA-directed RNA polymerase subunit M